MSIDCQIVKHINSLNRSNCNNQIINITTFCTSAVKLSDIKNV